MEADVTLTGFSSTEVTLLLLWLAAPHVAAWYKDPEDHVAWAANPPPNGERALIAVGGRAVDIDILIGEPECVGRGIGPRALLVLLSQLRHRQDVPMVGLTTSVQNLSAQRAYTKAGFRILREYSPSRYGRCYLMVYDLNEDA